MCAATTPAPNRNPEEDTPLRPARALRGSLHAVTPSPRPPADQYESLPPPDPVQGIKVLPVSISLLLTLNPFLVETDSSDEEYLPTAPQRGRGRWQQQKCLCK